MARNPKRQANGECEKSGLVCEVVCVLFVPFAVDVGEYA